MPTYHQLPDNPVFIDLETRSKADLPEVGGWNYAADETTRILTAAWSSDMGATYHLWFPGLLAPPPDEWVKPHIPGIVLHIGPGVPDALRAVTSRPWVAHNAEGFDRLVWEKLVDASAQPVSWIDSLSVALSVGLPGKIDSIGHLLWDEGKYQDGKAVLLKWSRAEGLGDCDPSNVPVTPQVLVGRYNVQDVKLLVDLWSVLQNEYFVTDEERAVLRASDAINARGARIDRDLVTALVHLGHESKKRAVKQISDLTDGFLDSEKALNSRTKVFSWLDHMGVSVKGNTSLRKQLVAQFITENEDEEADWDDESYQPTDLARVVKVLELRMQAMRVTSGKLDAALHSMSAQHRAHGLHAYHAAHTGRWAGRRIQTQNLPRPKDGVDPWAAIALFEKTGTLKYDELASMLPTKERGIDGKLLYPFLSVEDVASALIRMIFIPDPGEWIAAADLSQIEARMLAYLAGEEWLVKAFWDGTDPYIKMAEAIVGPVATWKEYRDPKTGKVVSPKKHPNRQHLGKIPELGCGYGMSGTKLAVYYAQQTGRNLEDAGVSGDEVVWAYRRTHPKIAGVQAGEYKGRPYFRDGFWDQLNYAALAACDNGGPVSVGKITYQREGQHLVCVLPSGRRHIYRNAEASEMDRFGKKIRGVSFVHPRYGRKRLYGGALAENAVQAASRDVMAHSIVNLEKNGLRSCLHVHDEDVGSIKEEDFDTYMRLFSTPPDWLPDFPLDCEGGLAPRYAKSPPPGRKDETWRNGKRL